MKKTGGPRGTSLWQCSQTIPLMGQCHERAALGDILCSYHAKLRDGLLTEPPTNKPDTRQVSMYSSHDGHKTPAKHLAALKVKRDKAKAARASGGWVDGRTQRANQPSSRDEKGRFV